MLLNSEYFRKYIYVSTALEDRQIECLIGEAEQLDVLPLLGFGVFSELENNSEKYELLLNGGDWDCGGRRQHLGGLLKAISYYTYARLLEAQAAVLQPSGYATATMQYSHSGDKSDRLARRNSALQMAQSTMQECMKYLETSDLAELLPKKIEAKKSFVVF